jgi:hypothetical protein
VPQAPEVVCAIVEGFIGFSSGTFGGAGLVADAPFAFLEPMHPLAFVLLGPDGPGKGG